MERFSTADSANLASREEIELTFHAVPTGDLGIVLGYRQTLLTTYLFYQGLAYMGSLAGQWIAGTQRDAGTHADTFKKMFWGSTGAIEAMVQDENGKWQKAGEFSENGPIATNMELIRIPHTASSEIKVKLRMTRGLWRIDFAALAHLQETVKPIEIQPLSVERGDTTIDEKAAEDLSGISSPLVTMPGDRYSIIYELPDDYENYELFLESKGYYLEWMRKEWIAEENPGMIMMMVSNPDEYLKVLAPQCKKMEPRLEESFWRSKYVQR